MANQKCNIVLVHGAFVDGSGWEPVYQALRRDGYDVSIVQNPAITLEGDVASTKLVLDMQERPTILVGHSYGGAVITEAGNDPKVSGLVYVCAFVPDAGESVQDLLANPPPGAPVAPVLPPRDGFLFLDRARFHASFAGGMAADRAAFMADSQVPWGLDAVSRAITRPAWRTKPSWYLLTTEDRMIPPSAQRAMASRAGAAVTDVNASHSVFITKPSAVVGLIETAATSRALAA